MPTNDAQAAPEVRGTTAGPLARALLWMLVLWVGVQIGAGLYEKVVVIPIWSADPAPEVLARRLQDTGQKRSGYRFWPYVSPVVFLLAIANTIAAWRSRAPARRYWLGASITMLLVSIATYAWFVPTMLVKIQRPERLSPDELARTVRLWTTLSPIRTIVSVPAWAAAIKALTLLGPKG